MNYFSSCTGYNFS